MASALDLEETRAELRDLRRELNSALQHIVRQNPAPAPAASPTDSILMQLFMAEREKTERQADRLAELQNPLSQIEQMQALADLLPSPPEESGNKILEEVIATVGGLVASQMVKEDEGESGVPADRGYADDGGEERGPPGEPFPFEADPGE